MVKSPADQHFLPYCAGLTLQYLPEASESLQRKVSGPEMEQQDPGKKWQKSLQLQK